MENKIHGFQFELVSVKPTHPSHNDRSDQDEPQKKPPEVFCKKRCSQKFRKTHCKTPVPESTSGTRNPTQQIVFSSMAQLFQTAKRCQPDQNACVATKFQKLRHLIWWLLLNFLQNLLKITVKKIISQQRFSQKFLRNHFLVLAATFLKIVLIYRFFAVFVFLQTCQRRIQNPFKFKHQDGAFAKIVNSSRGVYRTESNIYERAFCVNSERLKQWTAENFFLKKLHLRCSTPL